MTKEEFTEVLRLYKKYVDNTTELAKIGLNLDDSEYPLNVYVEKMLFTFIQAIYNEEGADWISWFIYENEYGNKGVAAWDKDNTPICYSIDSLYDYLEQNCKK
jgi:hypothetical protein